MKNTTIYKKLKVKNNNLVLDDVLIYSFDNSAILDEYYIKKSINDLKKYLSSSTKKYINDSYNADTKKNNNVIILRLLCKDENGIKYKKDISFLSFFKNAIIYL